MDIVLQDSGNYILRFDAQEEVISLLGEFMAAQGLDAISFYGIGSASSIELGYYNSNLKEYRRKPYYDSLEVISFMGNGSKMDDKPVIHAHGLFGHTDFSTLGGHVFKMVTLATCEIYVTKLTGLLKRKNNPTFNLNLLEKN